MTPKKILVTGATGFIGSRLCERLSLEHRLPYRALVRNYSHAGRIARLGAELATGNMLDADSLARAVDGCDAVIHLAHSDDKTAAKETALLVKACTGVRRFVHISSMAVHGPSPGSALVTETTPIKRWGENYSDAKAAAEAVAMSAAKRGNLAAIALRPTIVYGPFSGFVTPIIADARQGCISLIDGGRGQCNAVYVDDVCDAIMAALQHDDAVGEAFLVNGDGPLTWRDFIDTFAGMVDGPKTTVDHSLEEVAAYWQARRPRPRDNFTALFRLATSPAFHEHLATIPLMGALIRSTKESVARCISAEQKISIKARLRGRRAITPASTLPPIRVPSEGRVVREAYSSRVSNEHAKANLGWAPAHSFAQGAARTGEWLRFARLASITTGLEAAVSRARKYCAAGIVSLLATTGLDGSMLAQFELKAASSSERIYRASVNLA